MSRIILGVDFGDARTGLAVAGRSGSIAVGAGLIRADGFKKALAAVSEAAKREKAELIGVGNPLNMNGSAGPRSRLCGSSRGGDRDRNGALRREADDGQRASVSFGYRSEREEAQGKRGRAVGDADPSGLYRSVSGKARLIGNAVKCFAAGARSEKRSCRIRCSARAERQTQCESMPLRKIWTA